MKPKAAFIASYPDSLINFRWHLIQEFLNKGYQVIAIAPANDSVAAQLAEHGVKFLPIKLQRNGNNPLKDLFTLFEIYKILRREAPHLVFSYTIKPVIYGSLAAKLAGVKNIYSMITGSGYIFSNTNLKSRIVGYIAKKLFRLGLSVNQKIIFQNKDNLQLFLDQAIIKPQQDTTIVNGSGVDVDFFAPRSQSETSLSFLMIARFLVDKGVKEFAEAAEVLKKKYPQVKFKLVGWVDSNPNSISEHTLNSWINSGVIEYLGKLSDVRDAIAACSVYVLPSYGEGMPRTVLEAMAMGKPIITTDVPGCRETVQPHKSGLLVPAQNAKALSEAMEYFIQQPETILPMGEMSRKIALEKYDVRKVNQAMLTAMSVFTV